MQLLCVTYGVHSILVELMVVYLSCVILLFGKNDLDMHGQSLQAVSSFWTIRLGVGTSSVVVTLTSLSVKARTRKPSRMRKRISMSPCFEIQFRLLLKLCFRVWTLSYRILNWACGTGTHHSNEGGSEINPYSWLNTPRSCPKSPTTPTRISPTTAAISTPVLLPINSRTVIYRIPTAYNSLRYIEDCLRETTNLRRISMHWIVNVMSDVTSTSASVFKYPTIVTEYFQWWQGWRPQIIFSVRYHLSCMEKNYSKYNIRIAADQYLVIVSASDSRNSSNCTRLHPICSHLTARACYRPCIRVIIMPFVSHRGRPSEPV